MAHPREDLRGNEGTNLVQEVRFKVRDDITVVADYRHGRSKKKSLVVNLHGIICSKEMAKGVFANLDLADHSVLNVDLVGFGKSSKPKTNFSYSMREQGAILEEIVNRIDYDELHIVAHSMSGPIGVYLAEQLLLSGKKVDSLISLEGNKVRTDCGIVSRRIKDASVKEIENEILPELISQLRMSTSPGERQWAEEMRTADPEVVKKSAASLVEVSDDPNLVHDFITLGDSLKVVYVHGEESDQWAASRDELTPLFDQHGIEIIPIPGVGHFVQDNPSVWTRLANVIKK
jgi:pimeloyl-ACP methyl ester carboxylesterase